MSEINDLREKVGDLQVGVARLEERVASQGSTIDAMRSELRPLVKMGERWKAIVGIAMTLAATVGAWISEMIQRMTR